MNAGLENPLKRRYRFLLYSLYLLFILILTLAAGEVLMRLMGRHPYHPWKVNFTVVPGGRLTQTHPVLGYTYIPGRYELIFDDGYYRVVMTNDEDTLRITRPLDAPPFPDGVRDIWIFGCSFTYGYALNDEESYPWLLQERLGEYRIVNFGVGGYSTVQSLLQFEMALDEREKPALVIVAYASFHDLRNIMLREHQKSILPLQAFGPRRFPYARLNDAGELVMDSTPITYREFPFMRVSALAYSIEEKYNLMQSKEAHPRLVSRELLERFRQLCGEHDIAFVIAGINYDKATRNMLEYWDDNGVHTVDIAVDFSKPGYLTPAGNHPGAKANRCYADALEPVIPEVLEKP